jgi:hypothetical protein
MITKKNETLIYEEPASDYRARKYGNLFLLLFAISVLVFFIIIILFSWGDISPSAIPGIGLFIFLLIFICLFIYYKEKRKIYSNRLKIYENGIIPPTIYKDNHGFLSFDKIVHVNILKTEIRGKEYCGAIEIYTNGDKKMKREKIKEYQNTELQEVLKTFKKITIISWDIRKNSLHELLQAFAQNDIIENDEIKKYKHPISWRQERSK